MSHANPKQPLRPRTNEEGEELNFRTHISSPQAQYEPFRYGNILCQLKLYRWSISPDFVHQCAIGDLHRFLFWNDTEWVSKRRLGSTVVQTVTYEPRVTKNMGKAVSTYVFFDKLDLMFGLEWMMTMWMARITGAETAKEMVQEFLDLQACPEQDIEHRYLVPAKDLNNEPMKSTWAELWDHFGWEDETYKREPMEPLRKLADLS